MKKSILKKILFMFFAAAMILGACTKKDGRTAPPAENAADNETDQKADMSQHGDSALNAESGESGVIYVHRAPLYQENQDGKMKWSAEASLGDIAVYLGEKKEAQRATDGQKRTFFHINLKGKEYWIQDYCYEPGTVAAFVAAQDTVLYKSDSFTAATDEIIPQYFIVAVYKNSMPAGNEKFVKIATYCPELVTSWLVKDKFIKRESLELDKLNTEAMILAQIAMESRNDTIRAELFQNAIELNSAYSDDIAALQNLAEIIIQEEEFLKTIKTEKVDQKVVARVDVELLSIPVAGKSRFLGILKADTVAVASKKTVLDEDENQVVWYYIQNKQKKGWVNAEDLRDIP